MSIWEAERILRIELGWVFYCFAVNFEGLCGSCLRGPGYVSRVV